LQIVIVFNFELALQHPTLQPSAQVVWATGLLAICHNILDFSLLYNARNRAIKFSVWVSTVPVEEV
jgi:hypothetical protein